LFTVSKEEMQCREAEWKKANGKPAPDGRKRVKKDA